MTERLYYQDSYLFVFDCIVETLEERADGLWARLDRTAFYPESGGQPHDTGEISAGGIVARVSGVQADASGDVWHLLDRPLPARGPARGTIDRFRRLDHMRQHGGEHLLAGVIWEWHRGLTIGLHTGSDTATIDVAMPDGRTRLDDGEVALLEDEVNARIMADVPVRCWFPDKGELAALPLRKPPAVQEHVRIVGYGDFELVACGGTHPASSGQIGQLRILDVSPSRGKARFTFVCGERALRHSRGCLAAASGAAVQLSVPIGSLPESVRALRGRVAVLTQENALLKRAAMLASLPGLLTRVLHLPSGGLLVAAELDAPDIGALRDAAAALSRDGATALLSARAEDGCILVFARGPGCTADMAALLRAAGARGGGRPDFAQGGAPGPEPIRSAAAMLMDGRR